MTAEREKAINEWLDIHCRMCAKLNLPNICPNCELKMQEVKE